MKEAFTAIARSPPAFQLENDACDKLSPAAPLLFQGEAFCSESASVAACSMTALVVFSMSSVMAGVCANEAAARSRAVAVVYNFFIMSLFWL